MAESISVTWTPVTGPTATYSITRNGTVVATGLVGPPFVDTSISPNTSYAYIVTAVNANGVGLSSLASNSVLTPPGQVSGLTAINASSSQNNLAWTAQAGATSYNIYTDGAIDTRNVSGTTFSDVGLSPNTTYTYNVSANNTGGEGPQSAPASATTSGAAAGNWHPGNYLCANSLSYTDISGQVPAIVGTPVMGFAVVIKTGEYITSATPNGSGGFTYDFTQGRAKLTTTLTALANAGKFGIIEMTDRTFGAHIQGITDTSAYPASWVSANIAVPVPPSSATLSSSPSLPGAGATSATLNTTWGCLSATLSVTFTTSAGSETHNVNFSKGSATISGFTLTNAATSANISIAGGTGLGSIITTWTTAGYNAYQAVHSDVAAFLAANPTLAAAVSMYQCLGETSVASSTPGFNSAYYDNQITMMNQNRPLFPTTPLRFLPNGGDTSAGTATRMNKLTLTMGCASGGPDASGATPASTRNYPAGDPNAGQPIAPNWNPSNTVPGALTYMGVGASFVPNVYTLTLSAAPGATAGTLTSAWPGQNRVVPVTFSNGNVRNVQFTANSTAVSWTTALTSAATTALTYQGFPFTGSNLGHICETQDNATILNTAASFSPATTPTINFKAAPGSGSTGGTLTVAWARPTQILTITFPSAVTASAHFTKNSTAVTWSSLSGDSGGASATYVLNNGPINLYQTAMYVNSGTDTGDAPVTGPLPAFIIWPTFTGNSQLTQSVLINLITVGEIGPTNQNPLPGWSS